MVILFSHEIILNFPCIVLGENSAGGCSPEAVLAATYLVGTVYNFCTPHTTLSRYRVATTPAMAAGITDTVWSPEVLQGKLFASLEQEAHSVPVSASMMADALITDATRSFHAAKELVDRYVRG